MTSKAYKKFIEKILPALDELERLKKIEKLLELYKELSKLYEELCNYYEIEIIKLKQEIKEL